MQDDSRVPGEKGILETDIRYETPALPLLAVQSRASPLTCLRPSFLSGQMENRTVPISWGSCENKVLRATLAVVSFQWMSSVSIFFFTIPCIREQTRKQIRVGGEYQGQERGPGEGMMASQAL